MTGRVLEYLLNFKPASLIQIFQTSNSMNSRINDVSFPVALDIMVEWLCYLKMQEWLQLFLLMGTVYHMDSLMCKNLWRQIAAFPKSVVRFSTFYWAVSMKLVRTYLWNLYISTQFGCSWLASSKARPKWAKELMCSKTLTQIQCYHTTLHFQKKSLIIKNDVLLRFNSFNQLIQSQRKQYKKLTAIPYYENHMWICHHKKSKGED